MLRYFGMTRLRTLILMVCLAPLTPAYAYLDPGTGSFILQLLFGGVAGVVAIAHLY